MQNNAELWLITCSKRLKAHLQETGTDTSNAVYVLLPLGSGLS